MPLPRASSSVPDTYSNPIKFSTPRCSGNFPFSSARTIALAVLVKRENYYESAFAREGEREQERSPSNISFSFGSESLFCPLLHHPLKRCQQQRQGTSHHLLSRLMLLIRRQSRTVPYGPSTAGKRQNPLQKVPSQHPGKHLDAVVFSVISM